MTKPIPALIPRMEDSMPDSQFQALAIEMLRRLAADPSLVSPFTIIINPGRLLCLQHLQTHAEHNIILQPSIYAFTRDTLVVMPYGRVVPIPY